MDYFEKNFGIILCALFYYRNIQSGSNKRYFEYVDLLFVLLLSLISIKFDLRFGQLTILLLVSITYIYLVIQKERICNVGVLLISYAISYSLFAIAAFAVGVMVFILPMNGFNQYSQMICTVTHLCIMTIPFRLKRTKNNFSFINKLHFLLPFIMISIVIISLSVKINSATQKKYYFFLAFLLLFLAILLFIYWRTSITRHYLERLSLRNIDSLNAELDEKNALIKQLLEDKERMEKLNHKNYKLVPAMQGAVMHYLNGIKEYMDNTMMNPAFAEIAVSDESVNVSNRLNGFVDEGNRLLEELNKMSSEWTDFVNNEDLTGDKDIPSCGISRVDYILSYMHERSLKEGFSLKIAVEKGVDKITEKIISEEDIATLIADLIENAIIATRHNNREDIRISLGIMKKDYILEVYDSGAPFDKDVLLKYGKEKITTHADENGSGIGMMQTYEILSKCGASLYIDELSEDGGLYTKRISVVFNKKNQYVLYTNRSDDEIAYFHKRSDMMIIRK